MLRDCIQLISILIYTNSQPLYNAQKKTKIIQMLLIYTNSQPLYNAHKKTKIIQMLPIYTNSQPLYNAHKKKQRLYKCYWYTPTVNYYTMHTKNKGTYKCYWYTPTVNHFTMHKKQRTYKCYWDTPTVNHYTVHKKTKSIQMLLIYTSSQPLYNAQKNKEYINVTDIRQQSTMPLEFLKKIEKNRFSEKKRSNFFHLCYPQGSHGFPQKCSAVWPAIVNTYVICIINTYEQRANYNIHRWFKFHKILR